MISHGIRVGVSEQEGPVEADDGDVEVEAQSETTIYSYLIVETVKVEFATGKQWVGMVVPDVACVDEEGTVEGPVDRKTQLGIAFQLDVADAFYVYVVISRVIGTGAKFAILPSTHSNGASRVETALEGHVVRVAVGDATAYQLATYKPGFFTNFVILAEIDITTNKLGVTDAE